VHKRIRRKITGSKDRPRLSVCFTGHHVYAQLIDDAGGKTLVSVHSTEKDLTGKIKPNKEGGAQAGKLLAQRAKEKQIGKVVFDRGGFKFHGRVAALANAAREGGIEF
jgi:large subunit ribosomal protein L18